MIFSFSGRFGWLAVAAAVLLKSAVVSDAADPLRFLSINVGTNGSVTMSFSSEAGTNYYAEYSANLVNWTLFSTVTATNTVSFLSDPGLSASRFYRIRLDPGGASVYS